MIVSVPTWVFLALPLALLGVVSVAVEAVRRRHERRMLHAIFDGDRIQSEQAYYAHDYRRYGGVTFEVYETERRYY